MKIVLTSVLVFVFFFCGAKVKLIDSTSQEWVGGLYESGRGTDFTLTLKSRGNSDKLIIDKLWIGEELYEVRALKDLAKRSDIGFDRGDTIYIRAGKKLKPDENGVMKNVSGEKNRPPRDFSCPALLGYTWKGKRKFIEIKEFKVLEKIIYP